MPDDETRPLLAPRAAQERQRGRAGSVVDIKAVNALLERWLDEIARRISLKHVDEAAPDAHIYYSVFVAPPGQATGGAVERDYLAATRLDAGVLSHDEFSTRVLRSARAAIDRGMQPRLIRQGSSGSYFVLGPQANVLGIFKPKNEEPYGRLNPKWTKWLHRNLFPCLFGRSCLIPNLSYISEAAASLLDRRLGTHIVPTTECVELASPSFNYDYFDRRAWRKRGQRLPNKIGSLQTFLRGYTDASVFLRDHPWPEAVHTSRAVSFGSAPSRGSSSPSPGSLVSQTAQSDTELAPSQQPHRHRDRFFWTPELMQEFREQLERLVILDYIMRNTDRSLENWMVRVIDDDEVRGAPVSSPRKRHIRIGAIDNSLAFPWKHPDEWRSFPFGWLFLPVSLIGQPFSSATREHFLSRLVSTEWWEQTARELRSLFSLDADFRESMFARQLAVLKGQAWNVVEALKDSRQGPLELCLRPRVTVIHNLVRLPVPHAREEAFEQQQQQHENPTGTRGFYNIRMSRSRSSTSASAQPAANNQPVPWEGSLSPSPYSARSAMSQRSRRGFSLSHVLPHDGMKQQQEAPAGAAMVSPIGANTAMYNMPEAYETAIVERLVPVTRNPLFTCC